MDFVPTAVLNHLISRIIKQLNIKLRFLMNDSRNVS
uniref:Uncharacterized protein n=1 Tax=Anguilla anguilla TaxID=7936 RepID=A0A0E9T402_ANGAN